MIATTYFFFGGGGLSLLLWVKRKRSGHVNKLKSEERKNGVVREIAI